MALREALKQPKTPPNLRHGNARARCAVCRHYTKAAVCGKYGTRTSPTQLSDSFQPKGR